MTVSSPSPVDPVKLEKLAETAVRVGLQLQRGQDLVVTAPIAAHLIARAAHEAGYRFSRHAVLDEMRDARERGNKKR